MDFQESQGQFLAEKDRLELEAALSEADFADQLIGGWLFDFIQSIPLNRIEKLVFGNPEKLWWERSEELIYGTFSKGEMVNVIQPAMNTFLVLFVLGLSGAIIYSTIRIGINPHHPLIKHEFAEQIKIWFLAGLFLASYPTLLDLLFKLNSSVIDTFYQLITESDDSDFRFIDIQSLKNESKSLISTILILFIQFLIAAIS